MQTAKSSKPRVRAGEECKNLICAAGAAIFGSFSIIGWRFVVFEGLDADRL